MRVKTTTNYDKIITKSEFKLTSLDPIKDAKKTVLYNNFHPFYRLPSSLPLTLSGRLRVMSLDSGSRRMVESDAEPLDLAQIPGPTRLKRRRSSCMAISKLETIDKEDDFGYEIKEF